MSFLSKISSVVSTVVHQLHLPTPEAEQAKGPAQTGASGVSSFSPFKNPPVALTSPSKPAADPGEQRIQNTIHALAEYEVGQMQANGQPITRQSLELATAQLAGQLAHDPNGRQRLAEIGQGQLGFDPMHNSDGAVDAFLQGISDELNIRGASAQVAAPPAIDSVVSEVGASNSR